MKGTATTGLKYLKLGLKVRGKSTGDLRFEVIGNKALK